MREGRYMFGGIAALVLIGVIVMLCGCGYMIGVSQGMAQHSTVVVPNSGTNVVPNPGTTVIPYGGYGFGFARPWGWGFGLIGCLFPILFIFLVFGAFRFAFWRSRWSWGGPWMIHGWRGNGDPSRGDVPPWVREWHSKLHEQPEATKTEDEPKTEKN